MPAPTSQAHTVAQFRALIWHSLDNGLTDTALFSAERLYAHDPKSPDSAHLLALCLYRDGQIRQAEVLAKAWSNHVGCAYIFAQCCLKMGVGKEVEGISALEECKKSWEKSTGWNLHSDTERRSLPDAAAILCLLGKLSLAVNDTKKAVDAYVSAVKVNPFLWEAFTGLCNTGVSLRVNNIFKQSAEMLEYCKTMPTQSNAPLPNTEDPPARIRNATENYQNDPFTSSSSSSSAQTRDRSDLSYSNHPSFFNRLNEGSGSSSTLDTPTAQTSVSGSHDLLGGGHGLSDKPPPVRKTRATATDVASRKLTSRTTREANPEIRRPSTEASAPPAPARRSTRLNTLKFGSKSGGIERETRLASKDRDRESKKRAVSARMRTNLSGGGVSLGKEKEKDRGSNDINVRGNPTSCHPARNIMAPASQAADDDSVSQNKRKAPTEPSLTRVAKKQMSDVASRAAQASAALAKPQADKNREEAQSYLLDIYRKFGNGYYSLNRYYCPEALAALNSLPANQRETPRIQCLMGKAYYEMAQYKEAEAVFLKVRQMDPARTEDMEVFSTILWHQRKEVELSHLAHELIENERGAPESWCALGNCFALQRDHDQALKCFRRATQLNPRLAYAFTLQGHEHVSNEEYEKALASYRNAVSADNRHYNAWYGLGKVYEKMGKYETAEKHFRTAVKINPTNAVLICCVGMVLEKMKNFEGALQQYDAAVKTAPKSALSRFRKARSLMAMNNYKAALDELLILKDLVPDEANVHFSLGRLYKSLHNKAMAIRHLTIALNLDPKAGHLIKEVIENLDEDDDSYSVEDSEVYKLLDGDQ